MAREIKESNGNNLVTSISEEDEAVLKKVKSSFPCWQKDALKQSFLKRTDWSLALSKFVVTVLFVWLLIVAVGSFIRQAKDISVWFLHSDGHHI